AVVLGSGLGAFGDELDEATAIPYSEIPFFPRSTAIGHAGRLVIGNSGDVPIATMQGRAHLYEGYTAREVAFPIRVLARLGVNAALLGPSYETPAEIRYLRAIGADLVGMSTVAEAIAARQMGMKVLAISCVTNMAAGVLDKPLDHKEVLETGQRVAGQFIALLRAVIPRIEGM